MTMTRMRTPSLAWWKMTSLGMIRPTLVSSRSVVSTLANSGLAKLRVAKLSLRQLTKLCKVDLTVKLDLLPTFRPRLRKEEWMAVSACKVQRQRC